MINEEEQQAICKKAVESYGEVSQMIKAMEEMGELIQAISRNILSQGDDENNKSNFNEELADVEIMLKQLKVTSKFNQDLYDYWKEFKYKRLGGNVW